mmetsp:Transcript_27375/g.57815  ORF Transcript_27375/g.57815 Transcript_27375/m.57815 type:complete len:85 (-) Transcript_27375:41-295(-)
MNEYMKNDEEVGVCVDSTLFFMEVCKIRNGIRQTERERGNPKGIFTSHMHVGYIYIVRNPSVSSMSLSELKLLRGLGLVYSETM